MVWHRDKLKLTLMETPYLFTVFEHIIARDVVRKLAQVSFQFLVFGILWSEKAAEHRIFQKFN